MFFDFPYDPNAEFSDKIKCRFQELDFPKLAKDCGAKTGTEAAIFTKKTKLILDRFIGDQSTLNIPKRNVVISQFSRIQKPARKLLDALKGLDSGQDYMTWALQDGYEGDFPDDDAVIGGDGELIEWDGLTPFDRDFDQLVELLSKLLKVTDDMLEITSPGGAKGKKDQATYNLVHRLAIIYRENTGMSPTKGFTKLKGDGQYDGPFLLFVVACISDFAPEFYRGNSSLGNIIERAFKEHPH